MRERLVKLATKLLTFDLASKPAVDVEHISGTRSPMNDYFHSKKPQVRYIEEPSPAVQAKVEEMGRVVDEMKDKYEAHTIRSKNATKAAEQAIHHANKVSRNAEAAFKTFAVASLGALGAGTADAILASQHAPRAERAVKLLKRWKVGGPLGGALAGAALTGAVLHHRNKKK